MSTPAIEVAGVTKAFGEVRALDGVDLCVPAGTVYGLLGPNGSGKTTTVRVLSTIIQPDEGEARVLGLDVVSQKAEVRASIGLAGQYAAVDERLTARENLELVGRLTHLRRSVVRDRAVELLERFSLTYAADRPISGFSGGMRRRLDLAAALVHQPPVLFLDEPTTGLDPRSRNDLWDLIRELVADGTTLLLTTQYLEEADQLADHIGVIDAGRLIADGTASELKAQMGATVLEVRFADAGDAAAALATVSSVVSGAELEAAMVRAPVHDGARTAMEVLRALDAESLDVAGLAIREPSLDDVFLQLTGRHASDDTIDEGLEAGAAPDGVPAPAGRAS